MSVASVLESLTGLAQNIALLLSLALLSSVIRPWLPRVPARIRPLLTGGLFGVIAIAAMHTPLTPGPGVIADARTVPVLLAGPFGGPGAALAAGALTGGYRAWLGGAGSAAAVGSILTAGLLGVVAAAWWRRHPPRVPGPTFLLLGLGLDAILLAWVVVLPETERAVPVLSAAALPAGLFLPLATLVLGLLLVHESRRHDERERLAPMRSAIEQATEALFWLDADGRLVNANAAAARLTGRSREDLLDRHVWELEVDGSRERWRVSWAAAEARRHLVEERRYRRGDGSEVLVETSSDFVVHGPRQWISMFARDVTERRRLEHDRAQHLAREQALRIRAEEAGVLKDQFLGTLSHELRTPLTSILGYARLLRNGSLPAAAAGRALDIIERNTRAQVQLVNDLLDVSSIMLGTLQLEPQPVSLAAVVAGELEAARAEAEQAGVRLESRLPRGWPLIAVDAPRLHQIVRHLLSNAIKFTPTGGQVRVRLDRVGDEARLVVADTGIGIAKEFLPHVFERFRQADSSMTRTHGGLGLGLAIVRELVELHQGRVEAESPGRGAGSTFTVRLPMRTAAPPLTALAGRAREAVRREAS